MADRKVRAMRVSNFMVDHRTTLLDNATVVRCRNVCGDSLMKIPISSGRSLAWAHPGPYDVRVHPGRALLCSHPFDMRPQGSFGSCLGGDPRLAAPPARQDCDSCAHGHEDRSNGHRGDRHGLWGEAGLGGGTHICRQAAFVPERGLSGRPA